MDAAGKPRILCVCQYGHSRSVALCRVLHARKFNAVAVGVGTAGGALAVLAAWADAICVLEPHFGQAVPDDCKHKIRVFNVGPDQWSNPYHPELIKLLEGMADVAGFVA